MKWRLFFTRLSLSTFLLIVSFIRHILLMYFQPIGGCRSVFSMCLREACALCSLAHLLVSPLNRMDALVRTSLEPIRCADRDTVCPPLSLIQNRAALYSVYADFAFSLHCTQLKPSSQSSLSPFISLPCVYMLSRHMYCYHSVPWQDAADLLYSRYNSKFPSGTIRHGTAAMNLNGFLVHRISWCFIIECTLISKKWWTGFSKNAIHYSCPHGKPLKYENKAFLLLLLFLTWSRNTSCGRIYLMLARCLCTWTKGLADNNMTRHTRSGPPVELKALRLSCKCSAPNT